MQVILEINFTKKPQIPANIYLWFQEFVDDQGKNNMIFTEDLKNMIHIAENANDIELIEKMIKKFSSQNKGWSLQDNFWLIY